MITDQQFADLYPNGRTFYYEGETAHLPAFLALMEHHGAGRWQVTVKVSVPSEDLGEFYRVEQANGLRIGT